MRKISSLKSHRHICGVIAIAMFGFGACATDSKLSSTAESAQPAAASPASGSDKPAVAAAVATDAAATDAVATESAAALEPALLANDAPIPASVQNDVSLVPGGDTAAQVIPLNPGALPSLSGTLAITATVTVEVADVRAAVVTLPALVAKYGGVIYDSHIEVGKPEQATATITIKVPPVELESLIAGLTGTGTLRDRSQQTEEVSSQLTDLAARILTAQASVDRVRILLAGAKNLPEITTIEGELTVRETVLEQLLAQQRNLQDRVATSTLTVVLSPAPPADVPADIALAASGRGDDNSIGSAFSAGWHNFSKVVRNIAVFVGYTLPFFAVLALMGGVAWLLRRRLVRVSPVANVSPGPLQSQ